MLAEVKVRGPYILLGLLIHVLNEFVGYNCFISFQYYYLNIKILKFYEILENF